jgi:peptide/nickel transport system substrate-binding protein
MVRGGLGAGVFALGPLLAACGGSGGAGGSPASKAVTTPKRGGTVTMGLPIANLSYNPVTFTAQADYFVAYNVYRGLYRYDTEKRDYALDMAESVDVSSDGRTWTYKLKPNIMFHDGQPLTAADVKFSVETKVDPKSKSSQASYYPLGVQVKAIDDATVQFVLKEPSALLPIALAPSSGAIFAERNFDTLDKTPIGTGPFRFVDFQKGRKTRLERFDDYYVKGQPYLDAVEFIPLPEGATRVAALLSGQVQLIDSVPFERIGTLKDNKAVQLFDFPSTWIDFLMLNCRRPPFNDVRARQAVAHAIDREACAKVASVSTGGPVNTAVSDWAPTVPKVTPLAFDPDKARALVKELGLGDKQYEIIATPAEYPAMGRAAEFIATALNEVGMKVKMQGVDVGTWVQRSIVTPDFDLSYQGLIAGIDADQRTFGFYYSKGAQNWAGYDGGPEFDALLEAQRREVDVDKRKELVTQAWEKLTEDVPWYMPYWLPGAQAASPNLAGYEYQPEMYPFLETVYLT